MYNVIIEFVSLVSDMHMSHEQMKVDLSKNTKGATTLFFDIYGDPLAAQKEKITAGYTLPKMELRDFTLGLAGA